MLRSVIADVLGRISRLEVAVARLSDGNRANESNIKKHATRCKAVRAVVDSTASDVDSLKQLVNALREQRSADASSQQTDISNAVERLRSEFQADVRAVNSDLSDLRRCISEPEGGPAASRTEALRELREVASAGTELCPAVAALRAHIRPVWYYVTRGGCHGVTMNEGVKARVEAAHGCASLCFYAFDAAG